MTEDQNLTFVSCFNLSINFQSITIYRVKQGVEERKREIQEDIEVKDERSRMVNTEKEEIRRLVSREVITPKITTRP